VCVCVRACVFVCVCVRLVHMCVCSCVLDIARGSRIAVLVEASSGPGAGGGRVAEGGGWSHLERFSFPPGQPKIVLLIPGPGRVVHPW
jgi:hypothetical protein